jgi:hypothetical protein
VVVFVATELGRDLRAFLAAAATPRMYAAGAAEPCSPCAVDPGSCAARAAAASRIAAALGADVAALRASEAALHAHEDGADMISGICGGGGGGAGPDCDTFSGDGSGRGSGITGNSASSGWLSAPPIAEGVLHMQLLIATAHSAALADMICPSSPAGISAANGGRPLNCVERAHVADARAADESLRRFIAAASAFLARLRADGDGRAYLGAAAGIVQLIMGVTHEVAVVEEARGRWASAKTCSWRSPFWAHVVARQAPHGATSALLGPCA